MKVTFAVETLEVVDGHRLQGLKPDQDGYFIGVPVAVVDAVGRNRTHYNGLATKKQLEDPTTIINQQLQAGSLFGEFGHPRMPGLKPDMAFVKRVCDIVEDRWSHHFKKIYAAEELSNGGTIIRADLKPYGPYGSIVEEGLMNPNINLSFSLRTLCSERIDRANQIIYRTPTKLVTFDSVGAGGYAEASKRFAPAMEAVHFDLSDIIDPSDMVVATENLQDKDLLEIFGAKELLHHSQSIGIHLPDTGSFIDKDGTLRSVFHKFNNRRN